MRLPTHHLLTRLPGPGVEILRVLRTAVYRALSPPAALLDRLARHPPQPPLWLRRHAGPVGASLGAARQTGQVIRSFGLLRAGDVMLDVGCGWGAMAKELSEGLGESGRYVGVDVHAPSIKWARKHFASDGRLEFLEARVASPFGSRVGQPAEEFRFPLADAAANLVLAKSLFTHLVHTEAQAYLVEIRRVLRPGRSALLTAFLFDPTRPTPGFPYTQPPGDVRWRVRARPHAAIAYSRQAFEGMVAAAGLRIDHFLAGFWPGRAATPTGQDILVVG